MMGLNFFIMTPTNVKQATEYSEIFARVLSAKFCEINPHKMAKNHTTIY